MFTNDKYRSSEPQEAGEKGGTLQLSPCQSDQLTLLGMIQAQLSPTWSTGSSFEKKVTLVQRSTQARTWGRVGTHCSLDCAGRSLRPHTH